VSIAKLSSQTQFITSKNSVEKSFIDIYKSQIQSLELVEKKAEISAARNKNKRRGIIKRTLGRTNLTPEKKRELEQELAGLGADDDDGKEKIHSTGGRFSRNKKEKLGELHKKTRGGLGFKNKQTIKREIGVLKRKGVSQEARKRYLRLRGIQLQGGRISGGDARKLKKFQKLVGKTEKKERKEADKGRKIVEGQRSRQAQLKIDEAKTGHGEAETSHKEKLQQVKDLGIELTKEQKQKLRSGLGEAEGGLAKAERGLKEATRSGRAELDREAGKQKLREDMKKQKVINERAIIQHNFPNFQPNQVNQIHNSMSAMSNLGAHINVSRLKNSQDFLETLRVATETGVQALQSKNEHKKGQNLQELSTSIEDQLLANLKVRGSKAEKERLKKNKAQLLLDQDKVERQVEDAELAVTTAQSEAESSFANFSSFPDNVQQSMLESIGSTLNDDQANLDKLNTESSRIEGALTSNQGILDAFGTGRAPPKKETTGRQQAQTMFGNVKLPSHVKDNARVVQTPSANDFGDIATGNAVFNPANLSKVTDDVLHWKKKPLDQLTSDEDRKKIVGAQSLHKELQNSLTGGGGKLSHYLNYAKDKTPNTLSNIRSNLARESSGTTESTSGNNEGQKFKQPADKPQPETETTTEEQAILDKKNKPKTESRENRPPKEPAQQREAGKRGKVDEVTGDKIPPKEKENKKTSGNPIQDRVAIDDEDDEAQKSWGNAFAGITKKIAEMRSIVINTDEIPIAKKFDILDREMHKLKISTAFINADIPVSKAFKPVSEMSTRGLATGLSRVKDSNRKAQLTAELNRRRASKKKEAKKPTKLKGNTAQEKLKDARSRIEAIQGRKLPKKPKGKKPNKNKSKPFATEVAMVDRMAFKIKHQKIDAHWEEPTKRQYRKMFPKATPKQISKLHRTNKQAIKDELTDFRKSDIDEQIEVLGYMEEDMPADHPQLIAYHNAFDMNRFFEEIASSINKMHSDLKTKREKRGLIRQLVNFFKPKKRDKKPSK